MQFLISIRNIFVFIIFNSIYTCFNCHICFFSANHVCILCFDTLCVRGKSQFFRKENCSFTKVSKGTNQLTNTRTRTWLLLSGEWAFSVLGKRIPFSCYHHKCSFFLGSACSNLSARRKKVWWSVLCVRLKLPRGEECIFVRGWRM